MRVGGVRLLLLDLDGLAELLLDGGLDQLLHEIDGEAHPLVLGVDIGEGRRAGARADGEGAGLADLLEGAGRLRGRRPAPTPSATSARASDECTSDFFMRDLLGFRLVRQDLGQEILRALRAGRGEEGLLGGWTSTIWPASMKTTR